MMNSLLDLLFPAICYACKNPIDNSSKFLCNNCFQDLPRINCHNHKVNPVAIKFWGRVPFQSAVSLLYFKSGGKVQQLFHQIKYKGEKRLGVRLGEWAASELIESNFFEPIDLLIPMPLHKSKELKRGYNQSLLIANGIANLTGIPCNDKLLLKSISTSSQTKKDRIERWQNVSSSFSLATESLPTNAHLLLVDDVLTTGATAEAASQCLLKNRDIRLSFLSIALTY